MKQKIDMPFSALLSSLIGNYYHSVRDLSVQAEKHGEKITPRSIQRYLSSQRIPRYGTAKLLIEAAGGSVSKEDLEESLRLERELQKQIFEETDSFTVKITNDMMNEKLNRNDFAILDLVKERADIIYPGSNNPMGEYICDLIAKDMFEDIIES